MPEASDSVNDEAKKESLSSVAHMDNIERVVITDGKVEGQDEDPFGDSQLGDYALSYESTDERADEPITDKDNDKPDRISKAERREKEQQVKQVKEKKPKKEKTQKNYEPGEKGILFYILTIAGSLIGLVVIIYIMLMFVTPKTQTSITIPEQQTEILNPEVIVSGNKITEQPQTQSNSTGEIAPIQSIDETQEKEENTITVE